MTDVRLDDTDRLILNDLQDGFPVCERPFEAAGRKLGLSEDDLIARLERLLADGALTRFGPLYNAENLGGAVTLSALRVPAARFDEVAGIVNAFPEVAHNYAREHDFNMWFVIAAKDRAAIDRVIAEIERATGLAVFDMPKTEEYFVNLRFAL